jgi:hypothetical protein
MCAHEHSAYSSTEKLVIKCTPRTKCLQILLYQFILWNTLWKCRIRLICSWSWWSRDAQEKQFQTWRKECSTTWSITLYFFCHVITTIEIYMKITSRYLWSTGTSEMSMSFIDDVHISSNDGEDRSEHVSPVGTIGRGLIVGHQVLNFQDLLNALSLKPSDQRHSPG